MSKDKSKRTVTQGAESADADAGSATPSSIDASQPQEQEQQGLGDRQISSIAREARASALTNVVSSVFSVTGPRGQDGPDDARGGAATLDVTRTAQDASASPSRGVTEAPLTQRPQQQQQQQQQLLLDSSTPSLGADAGASDRESTSSEQMLREKLQGRYGGRPTEIAADSDHVEFAGDERVESNDGGTRESTNEKHAERVAMEDDTNNARHRMSKKKQSTPETDSSRALLPPSLESNAALIEPGAFLFSPSRPPRRAGGGGDDDACSETSNGEDYGGSMRPGGSNHSLSRPENQRQRTVLLEATLVENVPDAMDEFIGDIPKPPTEALVKASTMVEAKEVNVEDDDVVGIRKQHLVIGLLVLLGIAGAAGAVIATQLGGSKNGWSNGQPASQPTSQPTFAPLNAAPTSKPTGPLPLAEFRASLPEPYRSALSLGNPSSPQRQALEWLASSPKLSDYEVERQQQLYALATIYYATGGESWSQLGDKPWLNDNLSECEWKFSSYFEFKPKCYPGTQKLRELSFIDMDLSGSIPPEIGLLELEILDLFDNSLSGQIPASICNITTLDYLDVRKNMFTGSLPTGLDMLSGLEFVYIGSQFDHIITGDLPVYAFQHWKEMVELELSLGSIKGRLPTEVAHMSNLEYLDFSFNTLDGPLIDAIAELSQLHSLYLDKNLFTGEIPMSWGESHKSGGALSF